MWTITRPAGWVIHSRILSSCVNGGMVTVLTASDNMSAIVANNVFIESFHVESQPYNFQGENTPLAGVHKEGDPPGLRKQAYCASGFNLPFCEHVYRYDIYDADCDFNRKHHGDNSLTNALSTKSQLVIIRAPKITVIEK